MKIRTARSKDLKSNMLATNIYYHNWFCRADYCSLFSLWDPFKPKWKELESNVKEIEPPLLSICRNTKYATYVVTLETCDEWFHHCVCLFVQRKALAVWQKNPNIKILGNKEAHRLPIFSMLIRHDDSGKFLHHNFVSVLLNDLYGIQARGGCACAGPYAQVSQKNGGT